MIESEITLYPVDQADHVILGIPTFVLSGSSAWRRDVLHQSLQRLAEMERELQLLVEKGVEGAREILAQVHDARAAFGPRPE